MISTSQVIAKGSVLLYDQSGKLAYSKEINEQTNNIQINTSELSRGVYTIRIESEGVLAKPTKLVVVH